jgi:hypothetical protein
MTDEPKDTVIILGNELTFKQRLFVLAYLGEADFNGTEAARMAKYNGNDNTLRVIASENLSKPNIKSVIEKWLDIHAASVREVLWRLGRMVREGDNRDALRASELILKAHFAMGQSQDTTKLLNAPDFEDWKQKQSEREAEAEETLVQFDDVDHPPAIIKPVAPPVVLDLQPVEVGEGSAGEDEIIYEWDKEPERGRELTRQERLKIKRMS